MVAIIGKPLSPEAFAERLRGIAGKLETRPQLARERLVLEIATQLERLGYEEALRLFWKLAGPSLPSR